jgi:tRNA(fMet)-specific endonuclease VapC
MSERLAVDANAVIDLFRSGTPPAPITDSKTIFLPLPVIGELFGGAYSSQRVRANLVLVEELIVRWKRLIPDVQTARLYGRLRAQEAAARQSRINDLWIAALCIQHSLPLLTNDGGFDAIAGLTVLHW